jgi:hypothetical protein
VYVLGREREEGRRREDEKREEKRLRSPVCTFLAHSEGSVIVCV